MRASQVKTDAETRGVGESEMGRVGESAIAPSDPKVL